MAESPKASPEPIVTEFETVHSNLNADNIASLRGLEIGAERDISFNLRILTFCDQKVAEVIRNSHNDSYNFKNNERQQFCGLSKAWLPRPCGRPSHRLC